MEREEPELYSVNDLKNASPSSADSNENEIVISPFVKSMISGNSIPADMDYKTLYSDYLTGKYKLMRRLLLGYKHNVGFIGCKSSFL